jgi:translation initiation factor 1 (eIF-1/SUI1)
MEEKKSTIKIETTQKAKTKLMVFIQCIDSQLLKRKKLSRNKLHILLPCRDMHHCVTKQSENK